MTSAETIAALRAELEQVRARKDEAHGMIRDLTNALANRNTELAEAKADAARLDWLDKHPREATIRVGGDMKACVFYGVSCDPKWSMREAIDATIAQGKEPG